MGRWRSTLIGVLSAAALSCGGRADAGRGQGAPAAHRPVAASPTDPLAAPPDLARTPAGALQTPSGLHWLVLRPGRGSRRPAPYDRVSIQYTSWNEDGSVYATTVRRGAPAVLRVDDASPGWQEALSQMVEGEKRRVWIPAQSAHTRLGGPPGAIVTDLELMQIAPGAPPAPPPPDLAKPPADAERTASGLVSRQLKAPSSNKRAERHDRVRIVYVGWDETGRAFDSSAPRGAFAEVTMTHGFPGWQEALALLREGEKRRFWIPSGLSYDAFPGTVRGPLVYDIELVQVVDTPPPPPVPADVARPSRNAVRLPSGVAYRVLARGAGTLAVGASGIADVHYTSWTPEGRLVDSTVPNGRPERAELEDRDLPPGVAEVVAGMVAGERRRIWVPGPLAYPSTHPFSGPLVFDLQVLAVYHGKSLVDGAQQGRP